MPHSRIAPFLSRISPSKTTLCLASALLAFAGLASAQPVGDSEETSDGPSPAELASAVDALAAPWAEAGHLSGGLLVALGDRIVYEDYWSPYPATPIDAATPLPIASITKPLTIALASQLRDTAKEGQDEAGQELDWAAPIATWLPEFPRGDEIQLRHLLFHRSGLPHRVTEPGEQTRPWTSEEIVARVAEAELLFEPNRDRLYSSAGFAVVARILEVASGQSYGALLEERIVEPLGLEHTFHHGPDLSLDVVPASLRFRPAENGSEDGLTAVPVEKQHLSFLVGAGSVLSTPRDLHRVQRALLDERLGETARRNLVRAGRLEWNGSSHGYRAFADYHPVLDLHVIAVANLETAALDRLRSGIPKIAAGETVEPAPVPTPEVVAVPVAELERWVGDYGEEGGFTVPVRLHDGVLRVFEWELLPLGDGAFFAPQDYGTLTFVTGDAGEPARLEWQRGDSVDRYPRRSP